MPSPAAPGNPAIKKKTAGKGGNQQSLIIVEKHEIITSNLTIKPPSIHMVTKNLSFVLTVKICYNSVLW